MKMQTLPSLRESIDITFLENGLIVLESVEDNERNNNFHMYKWIYICYTR